MVAYNFVKCMAPLVASGIKLQTIRPDGKRHARVGEELQLYANMRTKRCRKLVARDPLCVRVDAIAMQIGVDELEVTINGRAFSPREVNRLAMFDGFGLITGGFSLKHLTIRRSRRRGCWYTFVYRRPRHAGLTAQFIARLWDPEG